MRACIYSACIRLVTRKQVRARAHAYMHVRMHTRTKTALKKKKIKKCAASKNEKTILRPKSTLARFGFGST